MKDNRTDETPSMFEKLMELSFRGASRQRLSQLVGDIKFHFLEIPAGQKRLFAQETRAAYCLCDFRLGRGYHCQRRRSLSIGQTLSSPAVIMPDFLFGKHTVYPCTVEAIDTVGILKIAKADYLEDAEQRPRLSLQFPEHSFVEWSESPSGHIVAYNRRHRRKSVSHIGLALLHSPGSL